ncbi:uncharacterized protein BCR38DRAFT_408483 [Pseudomassariella vexata]|uniref:Uncharacterized protein n=1 Tax=Pseudomassariella vexata TaxID=1141098 RepID=A0A1Y2E4X2_9PEZI|nr:uncharacterized protein BCR38DRAFT_408483 [Pseudomassariella vexata]ORY66562.1 hypothetical protein BCR38DRAFT_408483 [Pseudomassariella vexata]
MPKNIRKDSKKAMGCKQGKRGESSAQADNAAGCQTTIPRPLATRHMLTRLGLTCLAQRTTNLHDREEYGVDVAAAHRLNGNVIITALIFALEDDVVYGAPLRSVKGIVFLGTPHRRSTSQILGKLEEESLTPAPPELKQAVKSILNLNLAKSYNWLRFYWICFNFSGFLAEFVEDVEWPQASQDRALF